MEKAEMYREGMNVGEARRMLEELIGPDRRVLLKKRNDEDEAWLSMTSVKKLTAGNTVEKSIENGFTAKQHYAVVSDIDNLYRNAVKVWSHPDVDGNTDVFIHRFAAPLHFDDAVAYITVKENTVAGQRVHSAEIMEIKKLGGVLEEAKRVFCSLPSSESQGEGGGMSAHAENPSRATPSAPRLYTDNIRLLLEKVNTQSEKY